MKKGRLSVIQNRLLELEEETRSIVSSVFGNNIEIEKAKLEKERQFILDERNSGWKSKIIWGVFTPIVVSLVTSYLLTVFIR